MTTAIQCKDHKEALDVIALVGGTYHYIQGVHWVHSDNPMLAGIGL